MTVNPSSLQVALSVPRLMASLINNNMDGVAALATGDFAAVAGALDYDTHQAGGISVTEYGMAKDDVEVPITWAKVKLTVIAPTQQQVDDIKSLLVEYIHPNGAYYETRRVVLQQNTEKHYLIHYTKIIAGPTPAKSEGRPYWESILFVEAMVGRQSLDD